MPKRKATSKLSGLVDADEDDEVLLSPNEQEPVLDAEAVAPPAKKTKGRQKAALDKTSKAKPTTRKPRATVVVGPKRRGPAKSKAGRGRQVVDDPADSQNVADGDDLKESDGDLDQQSAKDASGVLSEDELDSPKTVEALTKKASQSRARAGRKEIAKKVMTDGEFEYTPTGTRRTRPREKSQGTARNVTAGRDNNAKEQDEENAIATESGEVEDLVLPEDGHDIALATPSSPLKGHANGHGGLKQGQETNQRRQGKSTSDSEKSGGDATLRRKLGDMTKKYENMEMRYRNLREVGIVEANANVEKLRKQCEATTAGMFSYNSVIELRAYTL
jgi:hypothetical protein